MTQAIGAAEGSPFGLDEAALTRLEQRFGTALRRARVSGGEVIASVTAPLAGEVDPTAIAITSRRAGERWFCFEQPDRAGFSLAALGAVQTLEADGPDRFASVAASWRTIAAQALADEVGGPGGSGLVAVGGFAFAPGGADSPPWSGFAPASLTVPEVSISRSGAAASLTLNVAVAPDDTEPDLRARALGRLAELRAEPLPLLDPAPTGDYRVVSVMPPSHYEEAVLRAVQRIRAGELEKVVLAREVQVHAPIEHSPAAALGILRAGFRSCFVFAVGRGESTFIGASPELLIRREGQRASTVALAGSTRRSADPAVDDHLGEQLLQSAKDRHENEIVARRIARVLDRHAVWVSVAPEPALVRVANIQHLGAPIRAQLASPMDAVELAEELHPTPAVGGEPDELAQRAIPALEGFDRGWYAGPVGWVDTFGDGEFCVALRCALLRGRVAHCYAGGGIVRDSDPAAELAETEVKLGAMLPVLSG